MNDCVSQVVDKRPFVEILETFVQTVADWVKVCLKFGL